MSCELSIFGSGFDTELIFLCCGGLVVQIKKKLFFWTTTGIYKFMSFGTCTPHLIVPQIPLLRLQSISSTDVTLADSTVVAAAAAAAAAAATTRNRANASIPRVWVDS